MSKHRLYYILFNILEISILVMYFLGITFPANILPVYLTVLLVINFLAFLVLNVSALVLATADSQKYKELISEFDALKDFNPAIPRWISLSLDVVYSLVYAMLAWYYCSTVVIITCVLSTISYKLVTYLKGLVIEANA